MSPKQFRQGQVAPGLVLAAAWFSLSTVAVAQTGTREYPEPRAHITWRTEANHQGYVTTLDIARLAATPNWDENDENPPLSARKAVAAARKLMDDLQPYGEDTELTSPVLKLRDDSGGHWFWVVYFSANDFRQFLSTFPVVVLMDGTVVEPHTGPGGGIGGGTE